MTKIFQAYRKQILGPVEMAQRLQRVGTKQLYPPPRKLQQEEFAKLCHRLLTLKEEGQGFVISVASSAAGEGASYVSYNLAQFLGLVYDQKVVWIDGNFCSPQRQLQFQDGHAFSDLLRDPSRVDDLQSQINQVTIIRGGDDLHEERAHFADFKYRDLVDRLSHKFDFAIIDVPPALVSQDAALMAKRSHGLLLVIAQRTLKRESIASGIQSMRDVGVNVLGAVMNRREFDLPKFLHRWV